MNLLRKRLLLRSLAICLIITSLQSIILPNYIWALTVGPSQPEYTAYEEPGATDMVNLLTGDFSFSLPILEVPGPEGSFSLPLSYHAGISPQQEASWVGLGWSLNAGAISRTINAFPDDANGESQSVTVQDLTGLRGWDASILGVGRFGWNNQQGHYGQLSLLSIINANWTEDYSSVGIAGFNVTSDGMKVDPVQLGMAIITVASWGATAAGAASGTALKEIAKNEAIGLAANVLSDGAASLTSGGNTPSAGGGYWAYSKTEKKNWLLKAATGFLVNVNEYKIWLDKTRIENMYGLLYLGNAPTTPYVNGGANTDLALKNGGVTESLKRFSYSSGTSNQGAASDINYQPDGNEESKQYHELNNPVFLAKDNFSVKATGITGSITPFRMEVGSVAMPREMTAKHYRLAPVPYLTNDANYKVPFVYDGQLSNSYFHHLGGASAVTNPSFYFGISSTVTSTAGLGNNKGLLTYELNDIALKNERIKSSLSSLKKIPQSNYIEWLNQSEIKNSLTYSSGYMDFLSGGSGPGISTTSDRYLFRNYLPVGKTSLFSSASSFSTTIQLTPSEISKLVVNDVLDIYLSLYASQQNMDGGLTNSTAEILGVQVTSINTTNNTIQLNDSRLYPFNGQNANIELRVNKSPQSQTTIGGFCITSMDGMTYHFALPIYEYDNHTEIREKSDPNNKKSIIHRATPYANTWLLTGITGSDFIDRNANGIIDDGDWGHWIKLNYGNHMNDYTWRTPYAGYSNVSGDVQETFSEGKNQLIYLNSIETRSHVALFLKGYRTDARSANTLVSQFPLKLDEIALIKKEHYKKLVSPIAQNGFNQTDYSNKINSVLLSSSYSTPSMDFIKRNCLKRIKFIYATSNSLAVGAPNSSTGKLTLSRISIIGQNDSKIVPDYKFEYSNNPTFTEDNWDAWGLFNPSGGTNTLSHQVSDSDAHGSAWSLTGITNPMGSKVTINYERDTYSSVSGFNTEVGAGDYNNPNQVVVYPALSINRLVVSNASLFAVGDQVRIYGQTVFYCPNNPTVQFKNFNGEQYYTIQAVGSNYIDFGFDLNGYGSVCGTNSGTQINVESQYGTITKYVPARKGGDIRVASIILSDDFGVSQKLRYLYQAENGSSSGVVAQEPNLIKTNFNYHFNDLPGYPQTSVIYGRTTVLAGSLNTDSEFTIKDVYEFETPHISQYTLSKNVIQNNVLVRSNTYEPTPNAPKNFVDYLSSYENKIVDRTSKIGKLKSTKRFDKYNTLISSTSMIYTDQLLNNNVNNYQGIYSEGVIMFDRIQVTPNDARNKINKTSSIQYPYVLQKVISSKDGFTAESENKNWDFLTGSVTQKLDKSSLGVYVKSVTVPAYTKYPELGDKTSNITNKNMLAQPAASYSYMSNAAGVSLGLIAASAQTWKKDWSNYRTYNSSTQTFADGVEDLQVWRSNASYLFKGNYTKLQSDGTLSFIPADDFNYGVGASNPLWQKLGESDRYDHFSMPLQSKDINGIYGTVKMGYDNRIKIAEASNAKFTEIAFTSAEDLRSDMAFFSSEVALGNATVVYKSKGQTTDIHTGDAAISLSTGYGFVYKPNWLSTNRIYRTSVWTNSLNGRIYYKLNGPSEVLSPAPIVTQKSGNWYLLNFEIPISSSFTSLEVGVKSASGTVLFDDFRFQPVDAAMVCYVSAPLDYESTTPFLSYSFVLGNDNLYTKYEFNEQGFLTRTFQESFKMNGERLVSENKQNFRRFNTNQ
jgi:hypothetical protein